MPSPASSPDPYLPRLGDQRLGREILKGRVHVTSISVSQSLEKGLAENFLHQRVQN